MKEKWEKKDHKINHFLTMKEMRKKQHKNFRFWESNKVRNEVNEWKINGLPGMSMVNFIQFSIKLKIPYAFLKIPWESSLNESRKINPQDT